MANSKELLSAEELQELREKVLLAIAPLKPATRSETYIYGSKRTDAGQRLPTYYLVYFLLVDLLGFPYGGREEKVDWTIAVDLAGTLALIEHRKLGLGIFSPATPKDEEVAARIVALLNEGVRVAVPFFNHLASEAVSRSRLNVTNNSGWLFERYEFARDQFKKKLDEAEARKNEKHTVELKSPEGIGKWTETTYPAFQLRREAGWLGIAAVEAFFSWTEHIFIHLAILQSKITTGDEVANLAAADWQTKTKAALDLSDATLKGLYDELLDVRRQIRNYMAHGAFGKGGEAFHFHSSAGAVPVKLTERLGLGRFSLFGEKSFDEGSAIDTAEAFITALWSGSLAPAKIYLQDAALPVILTYASDGTYRDAMVSEETMTWLVDGLAFQMDQAANMDW